jgi:hypothetical protein
VTVEAPMFLTFRTARHLEELALLLGGEIVVSDYENEYEWVIAETHYGKINLSRLHAIAPAETDIRIVMDDAPRAPIPTDLRRHLVARLVDLGVTSVFGGKWVYEPGATLPHQIEWRIVT